MLHPNWYDRDTNRNPANRTILVLSNFNAEHGRYRKNALDVFQNISTLKPLVSEETRFDDFGTYLDLLTRTKFVLSPPGFDQDCFRTYECMLMGTIPIVYSFPGLNWLFERSPTLMYTNWVRPARAEEILEFKPKTWSRKILIWHYWHDRIQCLKKDFGRKEQR